jgi:DNA-binding response OmpR family regulator
LLVVEDDERVMAALGTALRRHGFEVLCSRSGAGALALLRHRPDVILLDLGLPDHDGFHVCEWIRRVSGTPIIMTTARSNFESRVQGLNLGADDYLVKPYNLAELIARIHAVSRRYGSAAAASVAAHQEKEELEDLSPVSVGEIHIDPTQRSVEVGGRAVALTRKEFDLLTMLARQPGVVLRHEQILSEIWRTTWPDTRRTLHVHVASLRQKLDSPGLIESVHGVGYRLAAPGPGRT